MNNTLFVANSFMTKRLYIAVLDEFPDYMVPTLVAHAVLAAHFKFQDRSDYQNWVLNSFKKCVVKVNAKEFAKIGALPEVHLGHENKTLDGRPACAVVCPLDEYDTTLPNVLKFAKLWKPAELAVEERLSQTATLTPTQIEAEVLTSLAQHARITADAHQACDGSMMAQRAACLEWLAAGSAYQLMLSGGPRMDARTAIAAEENLVKQFKHLMGQGG